MIGFSLHFQKPSFSFSTAIKEDYNYIFSLMIKAKVKNTMQDT